MKVHIEIPPGLLTTTPDQEVVCPVILHNSGDVAADLTLAAVDLPPGWAAGPPRAIHLEAGRSATVSLALWPAAASRVPLPLDQRFRVQVTSADHPGWETTQVIDLRLQKDEAFGLQPPIPTQRVLAGPRRQTSFVLPVANNNDSRRLFFVEAGDDGGNCRFQFRAGEQPSSPAAGHTFASEPWSTTLVSVYVRPCKRRLLGLRRKTADCTISVTLLTEPAAKRTVVARLDWSPILSPLLAVLLLVSLAAGGRLAYAWVQNHSLQALWPGEQVAAWFDGWRQPPQPHVAGSVPFPGFAEPALRPRSSWDGLAGLAQTGDITYKQMFMDVAQQYNLDWRLLAEQAYWESRLKPDAVGYRHEMGLMQIMPATWDEWAPKVGVTDPYDAYSNTLVAAAYVVYLQDQLAKMGCTEDYWVLVAYNWGLQNVADLLQNDGSWGEIPEKTRRYTLEVLRCQEADSKLSAPFDEILVPQ